MPDVSLNTFPSTETEALAMLFVQSQDLSGLSPEEIYDKYRDAYEKIREHHKAKRTANMKNLAF